ncbi:MAG: TetR/AcrR family transcriptional regulator [Ruminococcaceae bacterium]|nr:TetR/AcrR family transcriptional regulator [Oscillospiraceae bacterium]
MKKSDITKEKILRAAETAFGERGLYGARVDEIAALAGVNKRMIYAHFGSKEELYVAVLDEVYSRIADQEQQILSDDADPAALMRKIIEGNFEFLCHNPTFVKMVLWENLNGGEYLKRSVAKTKKGASFLKLREILERGMKEGVFRDDIDMDEVILSSQMFVYSYFSNTHTMSYIMDRDFLGEESVKKRCRHITEMILGHILKTGVNG